jgi:hypothetical protein
MIASPFGIERFVTALYQVICTSSCLEPEPSRLTPAA